MTYLLQSTNLSQLKKDKHRRTNTEGQTQKDKHSEKVNIGYIILSKWMTFREITSFRVRTFIKTLPEDRVNGITIKRCCHVNTSCTSIHLHFTIVISTEYFYISCSYIICLFMSCPHTKDHIGNTGLHFLCHP